MVTFAQARPGIFAGESGGDYNALYNYQNREGGRFAGTRLTDMSVGDVMQFTDPRGDYAQYVRGQVGRTATPVGAYQVVGTTLRNAVDALGIDPSTPFNQATQDRIGEWIFSTQGTGAWEGYRGPQAGGQGMDGFVQQQPQDPMSSLSRGQRMMLGFAALRDAAASLEGQQSNFFNDAFSGIQTRQLQQEQIDVRRIEQERLRRQGLLEQLQGYQQAQSRASLLGQDTSQFDAAINMITAELGFGGAGPSAQPSTMGATPAAGGAAGGAGGAGASAAPQGAAAAQPSLEDLYRRANLETAEFGNVLPSTQAAIDAALEATAQQEAADVAAREVTEGAGEQIQTIGELREQVEQNPRSVGFFGSMLRNYAGPFAAGSEALFTDALVDEIISRSGFEELAEMRRNSPTGGALGQVTVREIELLQSTIAKLNPDLSAENFLKQLDDFEAKYARVIRRAYETSSDPEELTRILTQTIPGFNGVPPEPGQTTAPAPTAPSAVATHRFNPETGEFEVIE